MGFPLIDIIKGVAGVADELHTSGEEKMQAALEQRRMDLEFDKLDAGLAQGQADINKIEAAHPSLFVAGWRPAIGWICAAGVAYVVVHQLLLWVWALGQAKRWIPIEAPPPPAIDVEILMSLLFGMLGLGAYRTVERVKGAQGTGRVKW